MDIYSHYNGKMGLICLVIYFIMLVRGRKTFAGTMQQSGNYWFVFLCMTLYSVLGFLEPDTYHYYLHYEEMIQYNMHIHVEPFYFWLAKALPHSYALYRFAIWGTASMLMIITAKMLKLNAEVLCCLVPLLFITQLSVTRGGLGIALMVFCSVLFIQSTEKKNLVLIIIALLGLVASIFLHKSMIIFLVVLLISYFIPLNKGTFIISLILFPFLYAIALNVFQEFSFFSELNEEQTNLILQYQESEKKEMNLNGIIITIFEKTLLLLLIFSMTKKYIFDRIDATKSQYFIYKYAYIMVYVSFLFLGQEISNWISNRTLHAGTFALVLCASHSYDTYLTKQKRTLIEKVVLIGFLVFSLWKQLDFIRTYW